MTVELVEAWQVGPYVYQIWETKREFVYQCFDARTLETIYEGGANTPLEAVADGVRKALERAMEG